MRDPISRSSVRTPADRASPQLGSRAQASQIDFLNALIILIIGTSVFFTFGVAIVDSEVADVGSNGVTASRAADRVADDLIRNATTEPLANRTCTAALFETTGNTDCRIPAAAPSDTELDYLRDILGLDRQYSANVTIRDPQRGGIVSISGTEAKLGPKPPASGEVGSHHRYIAYPPSGSSSTPDHYVVIVYVWT